jgi:hypothetical protein
MSRYFRRGTTKIYFASTITDIDAPTEAEMAAATDITCDIAEVSGFSFSNSPIDVPDMCSTFVKNIPGEDTVEDSSMTFYEDNVSNPTKTLLAKGTEGYIVFFPYGITGGAPSAGDEAEVWVVSVASNTRQWSAGNEAAKYMVEYTATETPDQDAVVVA